MNVDTESGKSPPGVFRVSPKRLTLLFTCCLLCFACAFAIRLLEWPAWQNPEYRLGNEMLLATHDAYHWVAGAAGFGRAVNHPMAEALRFIANAGSWQLANAAFWLPPVMASLAACAVCLWCALLGAPICGVAAGLMTSIAPGFLGRTLLGYYDTDLVTLLFPLCMAFVPAWYARDMSAARHGGAFQPLAPFWLALLALSGIMSHGMGAWHSVFPYLIRCDVFLLFIFVLAGAGKDQRPRCLLGCAAYALPALAGWEGLLAASVLILAPAFFKRRNWLVSGAGLTILWGSIAFLAMRGDIFTLILNHAGSYLKSAGDVHSSGGVNLVFPSVAQSIIEVQDLSLAALFPYFHPWLEGAAAGVCGYFLALWKRPASVFLLPLLALGFSSSMLGGRMVMFGAPVAAIGIVLPFYWGVAWILAKIRLPRLAAPLACLLLCAFLVVPWVGIVPSLCQGPALNRRHAAALSQLKAITPEDATIWLWWDWGYAAQYFARRNTICDGAKHGGPSLYLPAAVFATDNPRFARQIIRRAGELGNEPGNFFSGMDAARAQSLVNSLRSRQTPLVAGAGSQYLVVSFEMLKLGFWISNYGNWNFITRSGEGGAISILPQGLAYNLRLGEVRLEGQKTPIFPVSINVFEETGVTEANYLQEWVDNHPKATETQRLDWLAGRRNLNFLLNRVTDEKLVLGEGIYNSLMTQLLLCKPGDPRFAPYFKLVYDNVFTRVYQVL